MSKKRMIWMLGVLAVMALIFYFSSQSAVESDLLSRGIAQAIVSFIREKIWPNVSVSRLNHIVRKAAHFIAYANLGFFLRLALADMKKPLAIGLLYAVLDEIHQMFVSGRGAMWQDVLLDFSGVVVGSLIAFLLHRLYKIIKNKKK